MKQRGLLSGRCSHLLGRAIICASLTAFFISCQRHDTGADISEQATESSIPGIYIVEGLPTFLGPSTVYEGVWLSEMEGSQFFENGTEIQDYYNDEVYFDTWIQMRFSSPAFPPNAPITNFRTEYGPSSATFIWVKFKGRRNLFPGPYGFGHLGTSNNIVLVEKVISSRPLKR